MNDLQIILYKRDFTTVEEVLTDQVENLSFSTKLHGGFGMASFTLGRNWLDSFIWLQNRQFYHLEIKDGVKTLFEGRLQTIKPHAGLLYIEAFGYWSSLKDQVENTAYNANADVVIDAALAAHAPAINADRTNIAATGGPAITSAANESYLDISVQSLIAKLLNFGSAAGDQWHFAVWEDRIPYMAAKSITTMDWNIRLGDLTDFKLRHSTEDLWNSVYAIYSIAGALNRTATVSDATSLASYGVTRLYAIPNLGDVVVAAANAARDTFLARFKDIHPVLSPFLVGDKVYDANGIPFPSSWIRAGQVIRVTDLVPATGDLDAVTSDSLRTFYIVGTNYDANRRENSLTVDSPSKNLDAVIARYI